MRDYFLEVISPLRFKSIRVKTVHLNKWQNYKYYVDSLYKLDVLIKSGWNTDHHTVSPKNDNILKTLISSLTGNNTKNVPLYIQHIFQKFCQKIKRIEIDIYGRLQRPSSSTFYFSFFYIFHKEYLLPNYQNIINKTLFPKLDSFRYYVEKAGRDSNLNEFIIFDGINFKN